MEKEQTETLELSSQGPTGNKDLIGDSLLEPTAEQSVVDEKLANLRSILEKDLLAAEIKWSLFVAACQHYKYDSCLKPFPPRFIKGEEKDIDAVRDLVDRTPALNLLLQLLRDPDTSQTDVEIINLLHWVLLETRKLKRLPRKYLEGVLSLVGSSSHCEPPAYIFTVCNAGPVREAQWTDLSTGKKTLYAFHGSRLENFYSIVQYGLQQVLNKNMLFGPGIYLTTELLMSLVYSPTGHGWGKSSFGPALSVVALCEVIDHPDVRYPRPHSNWGSPLRSLRSSHNEVGEVPDKYIVVTNSDLIRVRYLLVYTRPINASERRGGMLLSWMRRHKLLTFIVGYVVLLVSVGLSNNNTVQRQFRMLIGRS